MSRTSKLLVTTTLLLLAACGGGSDSGSAPPTSGIQGSGRTLSTGAITGFGSIFVNGVEFATSGAQIRIDDQPGVESDLRIGHIVVVVGTVNSGGTTGTATQVSADDTVEGPVTQLNVAAATFVVLGQTVRVGASTFFDDNIQPSSIEGLNQPGIVVEVAGFPNAAGEIEATRIQRKAPGGELEVTGVVQSLDTTARTFRINALAVDYSGVTPEGTLADGRIVEVKGTTFTAAGALRATRVEVSPGLGAVADDRVEIEGLITRFTSNTDFEIRGQRVTTDASTQLILNGMTVGLNVKVEAEGTINAAGVLLARKVEVKLDNSSRVRGLVEAVTAASGTLRVIGVNVTTSAGTQFEDKTDAQVRPFRLSDVRVGDFVEVRGTETQGTLAASILERDDPENRSFLRGVARNVADPNLTVLGVAVTVDGGTEFRDTADAPISRAQFFSQAPNRPVKARGTLSGATLVAEEIELE